MILTHFLAVLALPPLAIAPEAASLATGSTQAPVRSARLAAALLPALPVAAEPRVLPVRSR